MVLTKFNCGFCFFDNVADFVVYYDKEAIKRYEAVLEGLPDKISEWELKCAEQEELVKLAEQKCDEYNNALKWPKFLRNRHTVKVANVCLRSETTYITDGVHVIEEESSNSSIFSKKPMCIKPNVRYVECPLCGHRRYIPNVDCEYKFG